MERATCPACRTSQLRRRGDPLCPPCGQAAAQVVRSPLWALDSPLLRRMLAEANVPAILAVVRAACGLSQQDMAAVVGFSASALSYYERGRRESVFDVRVVLRLADAMGMPRAALLALVLSDPEAIPGPAMESTPWTTLLSRSPVNPSPSCLRYWDACADALCQRERHVGGTALLDAALLLWQQASQATGHQGRRGEVSAELAATAARVALYAGQAALDAEDTGTAESLHSTALELASGTQDSLLRARALAASSLLHAEAAQSAGTRGRAAQALGMACQAIEEARYEPVPELHALIAARHAVAASLLGDAAAFGTAIRRARRELDRYGQADPRLVPAWLRPFDDAEVTMAEASGQLNLGEAGRAVALYRHALDLAACPRDRLITATALATALVAHGKHEEAAAAALDLALPVAEAGATSARCLARLRHVHSETSGCLRSRELRERIEAVAPSVAKLRTADQTGMADAPARVPA